MNEISCLETLVIYCESQMREEFLFVAASRQSLLSFPGSKVVETLIFAIHLLLASRLCMRGALPLRLYGMMYRQMGSCTDINAYGLKMAFCQNKTA